MSYSVVNPQDNDGVIYMIYDIMRLRQDVHCTCLDLSELKQQLNVK